MSKNLESLKHVTRMISGTGGKIVVLDTGAIIGPESEAMLQALHSRSTGGIVEHLNVLAEKGPEFFMSTFYVGYNHKSIGDCGTGTVFIEGVSMLAAKAVQDWALYSGQESSTRYIDFSNQPFLNPLGSKEGALFQEELRTSYLNGLQKLVPDLKKRFPHQEGEKESTYKKAINARAFDIMRGFLPAGAATNLAWHGNLRQMADKMMLLRHHTLSEVREIALVLEGALREAFPNSFGHKRYEKTEVYNRWWMQGDYYFTDENPVDFELSRNAIDRKLLHVEYAEVLKRRPFKTELPKQIAECGTIQFRFLLDFGSFRDIQRHRAVTQRMPLLVRDHGFGEWYLSELGALRNRAEKFLAKQDKVLSKWPVSPEILQYYTAMGYNLPNRLTGDLAALVYLVELRATRFVHPTLRLRAIQMARVLEEKFGKDGLVLHLDNEPDRFDVRRGEHDIVRV